MTSINWHGFRSELTYRNLRFRPIVTWSSAILRRASRERRSISLTQGGSERCRKKTREHNCFVGEGLFMSHTIVRFATSVDEPKICALLSALIEGELVGDTPIDRSSAVRHVFHGSPDRERGSVIVFEVDGEV